MSESLRDQVVVCVGHGSEYAFSALAAKLQASGLNCIELNTINKGWREKLPTILSYKRRTILSSQHPYLNRKAWAHFYRLETDIIDLPEAIDLISPHRVFYVPHDLGFPIKDEEVIALAGVTAALMPSDAFWYLRRITKVFNVGWIGNLTAPNCEAIENKVVFLPSEMGYYSTLGLAHFIRTFEPVFELNPVIKFPMMDGIEPFEVALRNLGLEVLPTNYSAAKLIESSLVIISNGLSSIIFEAHSRGRHTICLIDGSQPEELQRDHFAVLDDLRLIPVEKTSEHVDSVQDKEGVHGRPTKTSSFNYDLVYGLLVN